MAGEWRSKQKPSQTRPAGERTEMRVLIKAQSSGWNEGDA